MTDKELLDWLEAHLSASEDTWGDAGLSYDRSLGWFVAYEWAPSLREAIRVAWILVEKHRAKKASEGSA